jgi:hypothetical protein
VQLVAAAAAVELSGVLEHVVTGPAPEPGTLVGEDGWCDRDPVVAGSSIDRVADVEKVFNARDPTYSRRLNRAESLPSSSRTSVAVGT